MQVFAGDRQEVLNAIREHLMTHGSREWGELRKRYASITEPTWWRWVRETKMQMQSQQLAIPQSHKAVFVAGPRSSEPPALGDLVANVLAPGGIRDMDHVGLYQGLCEDAERLRLYALNPDGSIRHPNAFERALKLKAKLTIEGAQVIDRMHGVKSALAFYDALLAEVSKEVPEVRRRVMDRLHVFREKVF